MRAAGPDDRRSGCLSEEAILAHLTRGEGVADPGVAAHLDACMRCQTLVAEAARSVFDPAVVRRSASHQVPRTLAVGERVGGRYEVKRFLGAGGMGEVYEVQDRVLHETVAIKTLACTVLDDEVAIKRLKTEVHLARKVAHPNVCRIFEFGLHELRSSRRGETIPFLTMELLRGETLGQRLVQCGRFTSDEALPIVEQMVAGLSAVHRAGIVHRDLKSDNVFLVGEAPRVVLMDFGLAKPDVLSQSHPLLSLGGSIVGTAAYMSPEQVLGKKVTPASDIYALGVILFEMMTGALPWKGDSSIDAAMARVDSEAPKPSSRREDISPAWDTVIARCLERDPARRYGSVDEVWTQVRTLAGRRRALRPRPQSKPRPRRKWLPFVVAATVATAAGLVAVRMAKSPPSTSEGR